MWKFKVIAIAYLLSFSTYAQWIRTNGPEGISIGSLAAIDGKIFAGTATDGIYVSTDDGISWTAANSGIENQDINDIKNGQGYLFAGTFGKGVLRSSDGGQTWLPPSNYNNLFVTSIVVTDNYIFAGTNSDGVYRSSDSGETWTQLFGIYGILSMGSVNEKIFASTYGYTFVTTDNGDNWSHVSSLEGAAPWSFITLGDTIIAGCVNEIYRSTNGGNTFYEYSLGLPYTITNVYSLASAGTDLFAGTSYYGILRSTDWGTTWSIANNGMGPKDVRAITANSSSLIAGSHYVGIYRSDDLGDTWNKSMNGFPAGSSITSMLFNGRNVYAGTRDGVYRSSDNGETWTELTGTNDTINYGTVRGLCEQDGTVYAGITFQFNSTVYKSTNQGDTWIRSGNGLPTDLTFINAMASSGNNVVAATDVGIYYSPDNGDNWYLSGFPPDFVEDMSASDGHMYAIRQFVGIYRSDDDGVNWYLVLVAVADHISMAAYNSHVYVGSFFEASIYSPNYGNSWFQSYGFPPESAVFGFCPIDDNTVLAGTDGALQYIYKSTDGGSYFTPYSEGLGPNAVTEFFTVNDTFMFAGTDYNGVWRRLRPGVPVELVSFNADLVGDKVRLNWKTATETNNNGFEIHRKEMEQANQIHEWESIGFVEGFGTTTEYHTYSFTDNEDLSGAYLYRLKQIDYDGSFKYSDEVEIKVDVPIKFSLEQNYPNPFNPSTSIKYSIPSDGNVKLKIYNSAGEEISTLTNEFKTAGNHEIRFNASELASGVYYYRLESDGFNFTKKMILLK